MPTCRLLHDAHATARGKVGEAVPAAAETETLTVAASPPAEPSFFVPEQVRPERYVAALIFLFSVSYLCIFRRYTTIEPDEGIILEGAQRILHGQVLYRDFFSFFTPGSFYLTAAMFKVFGNSFLVARTALAVFGGLMAVLAYLLARRVCSRQIALLTAGLVTLTALPYRFLVLHNWDSTLLACVTVYCAVRLLDSGNVAWAFALGSSASLTFLFEQSKGAGLLLGLGGGFLIIGCTRGYARLFRRRHWIGFLAGLAWPFLVTFAYFATQHALSAMWADWIWPLQHYSRANRVPYGFQNWSDNDRNAILHTGSLGIRLFKLLVISPCFLVPLLPLLAVALLVHWSRQMLAGRTAGLRCEYYVLLTAAIVGLLLSVVAVRADIIHFMYLLPLLALMVAWIIDGRDIPGELFRAARPALAAFLMIAFSIFSFPLLMRAVTAKHATVTRRGVIATPARDTVIDYVQTHVPADEPMLVYPYLPLYNYLTDTSDPSRYEYFQPGMNTAQQADEMTAELAAGEVHWVLFETTFPEKIPNSWPGTPLGAIVQDRVADYILSHYRSCQVLTSPGGWRFMLMVRKDSQCPS